MKKQIAAITGGVISIAAIIAGQYGFDFPEESQAQLVTSIVAIVGVLVAVFNEPPKKGTK